MELAERLHGISAKSCAEDVDVTLSIGCAASRPGEPFDYERVFAEADQSLYEGKHAGRNRVCAASSRAAI
jgi:PleD family two-component response regulator